MSTSGDIINNMLVMIVIRDVVYNKATDDFTVSVKDLKRDIVMDGERLVKNMTSSYCH